MELFWHIISLLNPWAWLVVFYYLFGKDCMRPKEPEKAPRKRRTKVEPAGKKKPTKPQALNSAAVANSVVEHQNIKTAEIEIPVIAEDVLTYEPGELGSSFPEKTRLYYSAEAISDPEYLETVMRSPLQVQTHQKNTSEFNRDVDGWPVKAWWDPTEKRVKVKGILHGEDNVRYAQENKQNPGFGTSAYISFLRIEKTPGVAPNGKPYDAIAKKAVNNHIAILPNIRDPKNAIVAMNAVEDVPENKIDVSNPSWVADESTWERAKKAASEGNYEDYCAVVTDIYKKMGGKIENGSNSMPIDKDEFKAAMNEYEAEKKEKAEAENRIASKVINELKGSEDEKKEPVKEAENAEEDDKKKEEKTEAENAFPSDEMVADFSKHLGITFPKTPTLKYLGSLVGIKETEPATLISALNAKREEFKKPVAAPAAQNSGVTLADAMNKF